MSRVVTSASWGSDEQRAAVGGAILRSALRPLAKKVELVDPVTPQSKPCSSNAVRQAPIGKSVEVKATMPAVCSAIGSRQQPPQMMPQGRTWFIVYAPGTVPHQRATQLASSVVPARRGLLWMQLPPELLQRSMDLLPSFAERARMCALCRSTRKLQWRYAAPLRPDEELSGIGLSNVGASAVAWAFTKPQHIPIGELCLGRNEIGDAGAQAIAAVLKAGCTVRRLSLRDNCIGDVGAEAIASALDTNSALEELDLWGNSFTCIGKRAVLASARCKVFLEVETPLPDRAGGRGDVQMSMLRTALFEWISQVHTGGNAPVALNVAPDPQDTLFRTFNLADSYLTSCNVEHTKLQLLGIACTFCAAALDDREDDIEDDTELSAWVTFVTDGGCTLQEVRGMTVKVRETLGFKLHQPTAYTFLRRYLRRTGWTEESFSLANYLIELMAIDSGFRKFKPQAIAAAAAVLCRQYVSQGVGVQHIPHWKHTLLRCADVDLATELAPCAVFMSKLHASKHSDPIRFVNKKYEMSRLHRVAKITPNAPPDDSFFISYLLADSAP